MKFGLMCQKYVALLNERVKCAHVSSSASAAGQAIATFIRNHYTRCNEQDDQPLLLKHHMSGTIYDDDLAPALVDDGRDDEDVSGVDVSMENPVLLVSTRVRCLRVARQGKSK